MGCENDTLACLQSLPAHDIMLTVPFLPRGSIDISLAGDQAMLPGKTMKSSVFRKVIKGLQSESHLLRMR